MRSTCAHVQDLTHTFERPEKIPSCNAIQQYITADIPTAAQLYTSTEYSPGHQLQQHTAHLIAEVHGKRLPLNADFRSCNLYKL